MAASCLRRFRLFPCKFSRFAPVSRRAVMTSHVLMVDTRDTAGTHAEQAGNQSTHTASQTAADWTSHDHHEESDEWSGVTSEEEEEEHLLRQRILASALSFVNEHGWTARAIAQGAETEGLASAAHGLFPRGGIELVLHHYQSSNQLLAAELAAQVKQQEESQLEKKKVTPFIRDAVEQRLRMNIPYTSQWPQAMALMALPQNTSEALRHLTDLMDIIWYHAGDRSPDFNWYTKRVTLAAVYKSTELSMLQDRSEDYADSWAFLERRLKDMGTVGKGIRQAQQTADMASESVLGICHMTRNVLGMNDRFR